MAFSRINPFYRDRFVPKRTFSFGILGKFHKSFRDTLPKFPFPNTENVARHNMVQPPRPVLGQPDTLTNLIPTQLNKPSVTEPPNQSVNGIPFSLNKAETVSDIPIQRTKSELPNEKSMRVMLKQLKFQRQLQQIQHQIRKKQEHKAALDISVNNIFNDEDDNKQTIMPEDREMKKHYRNNKLMQLQQEMDQINSVLKGNEMKPTSVAKTKRSSYLASQASNYSCYIPRIKHIMPDFGSYTPANPQSDNSDIQVKSMKHQLKSSPAATDFLSSRLDEQMPQQVAQLYRKESAMCLLCKYAVPAKPSY